MMRGRSAVRGARWAAPLLCVAFAVYAQSGSTRAAREELERQLRDMVGKPPTRVKVTFNGLDEPGYLIEEVAITLDGMPLIAPAPGILSREGEHLIWEGDYKPGDHRLEAKVTIVDVSNTMVSSTAGLKWKPGVSRIFNLQPGLEVAVVLSP